MKEHPILKVRAIELLEEISKNDRGKNMSHIRKPVYRDFRSANLGFKRLKQMGLIITEWDYQDNRGKIPKVTEKGKLVYNEFVKISRCLNDFKIQN